MPEDRSVGALNGAIRDILKVAHAQGRAPSIRSAQKHIRNISELDYGAAVRRHFDRGQLNQMLKEMRKALPTLNRQMYRITDVEKLAKIAHKLGVLLKAEAFKGTDASGLRGFYVNEAEVLKRPLIWVNTATHPTGVAASFWHEIGHHLTNRMWGHRHSPISLSHGTNYSDDLANPKEVAADLVRVLAGYPQPIAMQLFGRVDMEALGRDPDRMIARARPYVQAAMGFDFTSRCTPKENLYYLGGMIHNAKLRTTLLSEYGI